MKSKFELIASRIASLLPWDNLKQVVDFSNDAVTLLGKTAESRKTKLTKKFTIFQYPDWVQIIALTPQNQLVMVRQFRHGIDQFTIELPGGSMESGETPELAGKRELAEETGFISDKWESLGSVYVNPATHSNKIHAMVARDVQLTSGLSPDIDEEIEVLSVPMNEAVKMCLNGQIPHIFTHSALFRFLGQKS